MLDALTTERSQTGLHPVGRLDIYSTGALLLTNDGELTYRLTHPKHDVSKTYQVWVEGVPQEHSLIAWRAGIELEGRLTRPAKVEVLTHDAARKNPAQHYSLGGAQSANSPSGKSPWDIEC